MSIHQAILEHLQSALQAALIDDIPLSDDARAGVVMIGPLQGTPEPDEARISVTLHENDPDRFYGVKNVVEGPADNWADIVEDVEIGGAITWRRRFSVKARCLLVNTQEELSVARAIASTVRKRIERCLVGLSFTGIESDGEYVARGAISDTLKGEQIQAGGPPDSYDFHIKILFEVLTTDVLE